MRAGPLLRGLNSKDLSIVELDLSRNLLETWIDVIGICGALKHLAALELKYVFKDQAIRRVTSCLTQLMSVETGSGTRTTSPRRTQLIPLKI